jgi:rRNA-processing protein FCF1
MEICCVKIKAIVCDANILIDYFDNDKNILKLAAQHCFDIFVPTPILAEIEQISEEVARKLGLQLVEPNLSQLIEAIEMSKDIGSSENDCICLIIARDKGCHCATNEKALYNKCKRNNAEVIRGLGIMIELIKNNYLLKEYSIKTACKIKNSNPRITDKVVKDFIRIISEIRK